MNDHRAYMVRIAAGRLRNGSDAEDAVQDAALRMAEGAIESLDRLTDRQVAYRMADQAACNAATRDHAAKRDASNRVPLDIPTRDREDDESEHRRDLPTAPSAERVAMARMELQETALGAPVAVVAMAAGYTSREVAEAQGRAHGVVRAEVWRWRQRQR